MGREISNTICIVYIVYKYAGKVGFYNNTRDDSWNENLLIICNQETVCFCKPKIGLEIRSTSKICVMILSKNLSFMAEICGFQFQKQFHQR